MLFERKGRISESSFLDLEEGRRRNAARGIRAEGGTHWVDASSPVPSKRLSYRRWFDYSI